jgi:hypothetical protein
MSILMVWHMYSWLYCFHVIHYLISIPLVVEWWHNLMFKCLLNLLSLREVLCRWAHSW